MENARSTEPDRQAGLVVAIDGPASSGKSSVGAAAASRMGYRFMDTGLLYRALTWLAIKRGIGEDDAQALVALVPEVEFAPDAHGRLAHIMVDGIDVTSEVRGEAVDTRVSGYSRVPELRAALLERQRRIAAPGRIIVAGRDIGTVVLPDAHLKIYLNASAEERARRRAEERGIDPTSPEGEAILAELRRRDEIDTTRAVAPLRPADDARILVTDKNRFEDTVRLVVNAILASEEARVTAERSPAPIASHVAPWMHALALATRLVTSAITRVRLDGDPGAIPRTGPVILASNHASNADPVVIGAWLTPRLGRRLHWLGKKEVFDWPIIGWMARNGGVHPVDRSRADLDAFRLAKRILDEGHVLLVFPEGTRSWDGALQPAKDGVAMLALRTGAPIVPIAVIDSDRVWPRRRKLPRFGGRIRLRIGRPFLLSPEGDVPRGRAAKGAATARLMGRIAALLPPRQRGVYAAEAENEAAAASAAAAVADGQEAPVAVSH